MDQDDHMISDDNNSSSSSSTATSTGGATSLLSHLERQVPEEIRRHARRNPGDLQKALLRGAINEGQKLQEYQATEMPLMSQERIRNLLDSMLNQDNQQRRQRTSQSHVAIRRHHQAQNTGSSETGTATLHDQLAILQVKRQMEAAGAVMNNSRISQQQQQQQQQPAAAAAAANGGVPQNNVNRIGISGTSPRFTVANVLPPNLVHTINGLMEDRQHHNSSATNIEQLQQGLARQGREFQLKQGQAGHVSGSYPTTAASIHNAADAAQPQPRPGPGPTPTPIPLRTVASLNANVPNPLPRILASLTGTGKRPMSRRDTPPSMDRSLLLPTTRCSSPSTSASSTDEDGYASTAEERQEVEPDARLMILQQQRSSTNDTTSTKATSASSLYATTAAAATSIITTTATYNCSVSNIRHGSAAPVTAFTMSSPQLSSDDSSRSGSGAESRE